MVRKQRSSARQSGHHHSVRHHESTAPREYRELENKLRKMRLAIFWLNVAFFVVGMFICAACIYLLSDRIVVLDMIDNRLMMASCWLLIIASGITIIIAALGGIAAHVFSRHLLFIYAGFLTFIILMMVTGGLIALNLRAQFDDWAATRMSETLKNYYGVEQDSDYYRRITYAWDKGQHYMTCCGVSGDASWEVYRSTRWYSDRPGFENILYQNDPTVKFFVPESCCLKDDNDKFVNLTKCQQFEKGPPALREGEFNEGLKYQDCYSTMKEWVYKYSAWLAGLGLSTSFIMMFGLVMSVWAAFTLPNQHRP